jgi:hypothetical protein
MRYGHVITGFVLSLAMTTPAAADITLVQKTSGKGFGGMMSGDSKQYLKGTKMRTDQTIGGDETTTIIDAGALQMVVLNHKKKEAEVIDMAKMQADFAKLSTSDIKASITPTSETRVIADTKCTVHNFKATVPMQPGNQTMIFGLGGPYCLVKNGPGSADFASFFRAISEKGGFFGDPRQARAQPGQAKAMTEIYRQMVDLGVPFSTEMNIAFEGEGPMAAMMKKMSNSITTEVVSYSTDPIPDSLFEIPAGYKVKR